MYEALQAYDLQGEFVGWVIIRKVPDHAAKIEGTTIYTSDEADEAVARVNSLNEAEAIRVNWPETEDPDVQELLNDPTFESDKVSYTTNTIDEEKSDLVTFDDNGFEQVDWEKSYVVYKDAEVDSPVSTVQRIHKAQEKVARKRAGIQG